jgi:hypothetical protein
MSSSQIKAEGEKAQTQSALALDELIGGGGEVPPV